MIMRLFFLVLWGCSLCAMAGDTVLRKLALHWPDDARGRYCCVQRACDVHELSEPMHLMRLNMARQLLCTDCIRWFANDSDLADELKSTLLHKACRLGDYRLVEVLVSYQTNVNAVDMQQRTPLHYAVLGRDDAIARLLARAGASVQAIDAYGYSPINYAIQGGLYELAWCLHQRSAYDLHLSAGDQLERSFKMMQL